MEVPNETNNILFTSLWHLGKTLDHRGAFITPPNTQEGTFCDNSKWIAIITKCSTPGVYGVPNPSLRYPQTGLKQNLRRRYEKKQLVKSMCFVYTFHATYILFSQPLSSLILKLFKEVGMTTSKGGLFKLFTIQLLRTCWRIVVLKGGFFNFKLCPLVIKLLSISNKCSNDGSFPFNSL